MTATGAQPPELAVRAGSALVMLAIAGTALWAGGLWFAGFASLVGVRVLWEWWQLACRITHAPLSRALWLAAGCAYIGAAVAILIALRFANGFAPLAIVAVTVAIDVSAYFAGRSFGGPHIAPSISPSKTWAGLIGAMAGAAAMLAAIVLVWPVGGAATVWLAFPAGALLAVVGQGGDFFESWMKRRAGVKDSGSLIPGHGGLFDRIDGLIAVTIVAGGGMIGLGLPVT